MHHVLQYSMHVRCIVCSCTLNTFCIACRQELSVHSAYVYCTCLGTVAQGTAAAAETHNCIGTSAAFSHTYFWTAHMLIIWGLHTQVRTSQPTQASFWRRCRSRGPQPSCARSSWTSTEVMSPKYPSFSFYFKAGFKCVAPLEWRAHFLCNCPFMLFSVSLL